MNPVLAIGMMSGTSVDGAVDTAAILTDGEDFVERQLTGTHCYESSNGLRPIHHLTKAAEIAYRRARGNHDAAAAVYPQALQDYVQTTFQLTAPQDIDNKIAQLSRAFDDTKQTVTLSDIIDRSTQLHAEAAEKALAELGDDAAKVGIVGYHGQTLYHAPFDHITVQVGNAQTLADRLGVPVAFDFRRNDIEHGGQGAPVAPVYHRALLRKAGLPSAAILNLGGTANLTIVSKDDDAIIGFDTGPANGLIDRYVKEKGNLGLDRDSHLALAGSVSEAVLRLLTDRGIRLADKRNYLDIQPPKSLDIRDYHFDFPEFHALKLEDGCATLNAFSAYCIAQALDWLPPAGFTVPEQWILCGGGAQSPHLRDQILTRVKAKTGKNIELLSADEVGWSAQGMEAELLAFLAVRASRNLPITFPGTTGVAEPLPGGKIFYPATARQKKSG